jgi:anaerobic ribonucleoside-triphosphate reductase activating protein
MFERGCEREPLFPSLASRDPAERWPNRRHLTVDALRVARIVPVTQAEGPGSRWAIWVQGCSIGCAGCCNPHTWDPGLGTDIAVTDLIDQMLDATVEGITFLGGEPFEQADGLSTLAEAAQRAGRGVMTFTGYRHEAIRRSSRSAWASLLAATDLLVDGPYVQERRDTVRPSVGSTNQRFIHLTDRYHGQIPNAGHDQVEVRIRRDGLVALNGWPEGQLVRTGGAARG